MRIHLSSILSPREHRWLTVFSPEEPEGTELVLEPDFHSAVSRSKRHWSATESRSRPSLSSTSPPSSTAASARHRSGNASSQIEGGSARGRRRHGDRAFGGAERRRDRGALSLGRELLCGTVVRLEPPAQGGFPASCGVAHLRPAVVLERLAERSPGCRGALQVARERDGTQPGWIFGSEHGGLRIKTGGLSGDEVDALLLSPLD